jgi:hypothetical protein
MTPEEHATRAADLLASIDARVALAAEADVVLPREELDYVAGLAAAYALTALALHFTRKR